MKYQYWGAYNGYLPFATVERVGDSHKVTLCSLENQADKNKVFVETPTRNNFLTYDDAFSAAFEVMRAHIDEVLTKSH